MSCFTDDDFNIYSARSDQKATICKIFVFTDKRISSDKDTERRKNDWLNLLGQYDRYCACSFSSSF